MTACTCSSGDGHPHFPHDIIRCGCGVPAYWQAQWSDRQAWVCRAHVDNIYRRYFSDHSYDQTGIMWRGADGEDQYESMFPLRRQAHLFKEEAV